MVEFKLASAANDLVTFHILSAHGRAFITAYRTMCMDLIRDVPSNISVVFGLATRITQSCMRSLVFVNGRIAACIFESAS